MMYYLGNNDKKISLYMFSIDTIILDYFCFKVEPMDMEPVEMGNQLQFGKQLIPLTNPSPFKEILMC